MNLDTLNIKVITNLNIAKLRRCRITSVDILLMVCILGLFSLYGCSVKETKLATEVSLESVDVEQPEDITDLVIAVDENIVIFGNKPDVGENEAAVGDEISADTQGVEIDSVDLQVQAVDDDTAMDSITSADLDVYDVGVANVSDNQSKKVIYLTFDDGPSDLTEKILQILKENNVNATFFVTGKRQYALKFVRQAYDEGNVIAAHTYRHHYDIYRSFDAYFDDLEKIEALIERTIGERTPFIRFPGGSSNHIFAKYNSDPEFMIKLAKEVRRRGYQYFDWNLSSRDASARVVDAETIKAKACRAKDRIIYLLMHDNPAKTTTVEALPDIIQFFKDEGYEFATISNKGYCHHTIRPYSRDDGMSNVENVSSME